MSTEALWALAGLWLSAFTSATVLPGNSEAALLALLWWRPELWLPALLVATLGNTLGGLTSVWLGRRLPAGAMPEDGRLARWLPRLQHWGTPLLLLSWVPVLGDALCVAAGWLRLPWLSTTLMLVAGKLFRYGALILISRQFGA